MGIELIEPDLMTFVQREVASGKFRSQEEVVAEGLRMLRERERQRDALRADILAGIEQLDRGEGIVIDSPEAEAAFVSRIVGGGTSLRQ
jgi:putative addiction module CopG family antidote